MEALLPSQRTETNSVHSTNSDLTTPFMLLPPNPEISADTVVNAAESSNGGSDTGSDEDEAVEAAVLTRDRRTGAGNRLRALLDQEQELEAEEVFAEEANDIDFLGNEEADIFDTDFEETSSEEGEDDGDPNAEDAGEKRLRREEKAARRAERAKDGKTNKPFYAFERSAAARKREIYKLRNGEEPARKRRRFSPGGPGRTLGERSSTRTAAVQFSKAVDEREREELKRKEELAPKRIEQREKRKKEKAKTWTQTELVEEALRTEEVNKASLQAFYQAEEERKLSQATGLGGYGIYGPRITFISTTRGTSKFSSELILPKPSAEEVTREEVAQTTLNVNVPSRFLPPTVPPVTSTNLPLPSFQTQTILPKPHTVPTIAQSNPSAQTPSSSLSSQIYIGSTASSTAQSLPLQIANGLSFSLTHSPESTLHMALPPNPLQSTNWRTLQSTAVPQGQPPLVDNYSQPASSMSTTLQYVHGRQSNLPEGFAIAREQEVSRNEGQRQSRSLEIIAAPNGSASFAKLSTMPSSAALNVQTPTQGSTVASTSAKPYEQVKSSSKLSELTALDDPHTGNYLLVADLDQLEHFKNMRVATLEALFGDHVDWSNSRASSAKNRPPRRDTICLFTGLIAKYRDPETGVPYANSEAYKTLVQIQKQGDDGGYIWSPYFACFVRPAPTSTIHSGINDSAITSIALTLDGEGSIEDTPTVEEEEEEEEEDEKDANTTRGTFRVPWLDPKISKVRGKQRRENHAVESLQEADLDSSARSAKRAAKKGSKFKSKPREIKEEKNKPPRSAPRERSILSRKARPSAGTMREESPVFHVEIASPAEADVYPT